MPLHVVEKVIGGFMVLDLRGRITLGPDTEAVRNKVKEVIEAGHQRVILDLGGVSYIDSAGLSTLVACYISARKAGGEVKLLNLTKFVRDLLQITRLSTVFETYDNLEAAQRSWGPSVERDR
jgi:anti-sigma B factor antagonist